jgi:hypothetical protein
MISVDTVYQKVLAIANKEQRGYITPQEFNLLADKAQMEIFENYFNEEDRYRRVASNDTTYSDNATSVQSKIDHFEKYNEILDMSNGGGIAMLPDNYKIGSLFYRPGNDLTKSYKIDIVDQNEIGFILSSKTLAPTLTRPVYTRFSINQDDNVGRERRIQIYPVTITTDVYCNYLARPNKPNWSYVLVKQKALYNRNLAVDFELHKSEEENLVNRILQLAGVVTKNPDIQQSAFLDKQLVTQQKNN